MSDEDYPDINDTLRDEGDDAVRKRFDEAVSQFIERLRRAAPAARREAARTSAKHGSAPTAERDQASNHASVLSPSTT